MNCSYHSVMELIIAKLYKYSVIQRIHYLLCIRIDFLDRIFPNNCNMVFPWGNLHC